MAKATGFKVTCPFCGAPEDDGRVSLDLNTFRCECSNCGEEFTAQQARDKALAAVRAWEMVARWVELAPSVCEQTPRNLKLAE